MPRTREAVDHGLKIQEGGWLTVAAAARVIAVTSSGERTDVSVWRASYISSLMGRKVKYFQKWKFWRRLRTMVCSASTVVNSMAPHMGFGVVTR